MPLIVTFDLISLLASLAALAILFAGWRRIPGREVKLFIAGLLISNSFYASLLALEWSGITQALDPYEDVIGALIPMWWAFIFYAFILHGRNFDLRKSEENYRLLAYNSIDCIWLLDLDLNFKYINPAIEQMMGFKPEEWIGSNLAEHANSNNLAIMKDVAARMMQNLPETPGITFEVEMLDINGKMVPLEISGKAILDSDGNPVGLQGISRDISERKQADDRLLRERDLSRQIVNSLPGIFYMFVGEQLVSWNLEFETISGYSSNELSKLHVTDFFEVDNRALVTEHIQEVYREGSTSLEAALLTKDGNKIPFLFTGKRCDFNGVPHLVGLGVDITERKRVEEALRESEERFRTLVEASSDWIWEVDRNGTYTYSSPKIKDVLGYEPQEALGKTAFDFMAPGEAMQNSMVFHDALRNGQPLSGLENTAIHRDGRGVVLETNGVPIRDEDGRIVGYRGVDRDITERKQVERERERLIAKLEVQNDELEQFTYTVSHDLKSPLITVNGFVGMLRQDLDEGNREAVELDLTRISAAVDKMGRLLKELLELSRIGRLVNPPQHVALEELAHKAMDLTHGQIEQRGVQVEVLADLPVVYGDKVRLLQVLQNLIDNAVKYMGDQARPRIEIGSRQDGVQTVCYVRDNGIGIESSYTKKVFALFEQLDQEAEGSGIGLAVVKRIVEVHGGRIWVESEGPARGSTFCFTLPRQKSTLQTD